MLCVLYCENSEQQASGALTYSSILPCALCRVLAAAYELELERKRSKLNYTVNVVKTIEIERQIAASAAATGVDVTAASDHARPPLARPPSAYSMHLAARKETLAAEAAAQQLQQQQQQQQSQPPSSASGSASSISSFAPLPGQAAFDAAGGAAAASSASGFDRRSQRRSSLLGMPASAPASSASSAPATAAQEAASSPAFSPSPPSSASASSAPAESFAASSSSPWICGPAEGERAAMRKRITEYLLRRTPSAAGSPAQAAYLADVVVPSVEECLYRDAQGGLPVHAVVSTCMHGIRHVM